MNKKEAVTHARKLCEYIKSLDSGSDDWKCIHALLVLVEHEYMEDEEYGSPQAVASRMDENDEQMEQVLMFLTAAEKTAHEYSHLSEAIQRIYKDRQDYLRRLITKV